MEDAWWERGRENRRVNNSVCLRYSVASRFWVAPRLATSSDRLTSVRSQGPVVVCPRTHTHIHWRELLPWEPTPLWLFPSPENNRHQSSSTSLSLSLSLSASSFLLFFCCCKPPIPLHHQDWLPVSYPPPLSSPPCPEAITHLLLFPSSACLWQSWVWFVMHNLSKLGICTVLSVFSQLKSKTLSAPTLCWLFSACN